MKGAYYNEIDPFAAQWLRNLIAGGHIAPGEVDERSIEDVTPDDLRGFTQCHFFAGIGVWSYSLRLAGWPDNRPVWTGSCPCQPFSSAGKGAGVNDERHLWPHFHWLIQQCQPQTVFGEQVASKDGLAWLDTVLADLEGTGYAGAALDLCAAGVGAPHIRQRLFWMANANVQQRQERLSGLGESYSPQSCRKTVEPARFCLPGGVGDSDCFGRQHVETESGGDGTGVEQGECIPLHPGYSGCDVSGLEHANGDGRQGWLFGWQDTQRGALDRQAGRNSAAISTLQVNGFWRDADWLFCRDGKWRPVEPGTFPLVDGAAARMGRVEPRVARVASSNRVGRIKGYGNAINAQAAAHFIRASMEVIYGR